MSSWWRDAVVYQVYPRSFADDSGDGIGDLAGITSHLDDLVALGVDALWLSPFYRSPQVDAGYDVADYCAVDPVFGTLADFDSLIARAHHLGLRAIVDLVPNHCSDQHPWFADALAAEPGSAARDRFIFCPGRGPGQPPNNWRSVFGGTAWTQVDDGQWYLHLFDAAQPDWNWSHPQVRAEFVRILRFWLDRGVDGFRVDVAHGLVKADGLPDLPGAPVDTSGATAPIQQAPMWDQDGVHEIYRSWRAVLDSYDGERIMVAEAWIDPLSRLARYVRSDEMNQAFNFDYLTAPWDAAHLRMVITSSLAANDAVGAPTTWVLSNHDVIRHASRLGLPPGEVPNGIGATDIQPDAQLGLRRARAATALMLALPGSAYVYQGEELGLPEHTTLPDELRQDPTWSRTGFAERGRDGCRVPYPWSAAGASLGFSATGASWLPQPASYAALAYDAQDGVDGSTLSMYRKALSLRREYGLGAGSLTWLEGYPDQVIAFDNGSVTVLANLGTQPIPLPKGRLLLASEPTSGLLAADVTVWFA